MVEDSSSEWIMKFVTILLICQIGSILQGTQARDMRREGQFRRNLSYPVTHWWSVETTWWGSVLRMLLALFPGPFQWTGNEATMILHRWCNSMIVSTATKLHIIYVCIYVDDVCILQDESKWFTKPQGQSKQTSQAFHSGFSLATLENFLWSCKTNIGMESQ